MLPGPFRSFNRTDPVSIKCAMAMGFPDKIQPRFWIQFSFFSVSFLVFSGSISRNVYHFLACSTRFKLPSFLSRFFNAFLKLDTPLRNTWHIHIKYVLFNYNEMSRKMPFRGSIFWPQPLLPPKVPKSKNWSLLQRSWANCAKCRRGPTKLHKRFFDHVLGFFSG